jgi:hypothetical protein
MFCVFEGQCSRILVTQLPFLDVRVSVDRTFARTFGHKRQTAALRRHRFARKFHESFDQMVELDEQLWWL